MTPIEVMQQHYRQRDLAAREWKAKGGKVVAYFCDSVPEELILAAGAFPLRISGDPDADSGVARRHVVPRFAAREDFVHSMLNQLLTGRYHYVDLLVIPHARDSVHRLYQLLCALKQSEPLIKLPDIYFLDVLHTTFFSSGCYNRLRLCELKKKLESLTGAEIMNEALSRAIAVTNENRRLLKKVAALRAEGPPRVSGVEALQMIGSSLFMAKEEHSRLLNEYLGASDDLPELEGVRIFVSGSPLDNLQLYEIIESAPATVVGEDHCWGNRYSDTAIDTSLDPWEAIGDRYQFKPPCPRMHPLSRRIEYCVASALAVRAEAVIVNAYQHASAEAWEMPDLRKAFEERGLPTLCLKDQSYKIGDPEGLKRRLADFIRAVKAGATPVELVEGP